MSMTFCEVAAKLVKHKIVRLFNVHLETSYQRVRLLSKNLMAFEPGTIYVGVASEGPANLDQHSDIGLILINNCDFDFSRLKGNAAELPAETDFFGLFNAVLDLFNASRRAVDISAALLNCLVQGKGLNALIQTGAELIGKPVSLVDYTGKVLAISGQQPTYAMGLTSEGYPTQAEYSIFRTHKFTKKVNESPHPILVDFDHSELPRMIVGKIAINQKIVGHLAVLENEQPFTDEDIEIVSVLIDAVTVEVQKNNFYLVMAGIDYEHLILDLLQEKLDNPTTIEDRIRSLQWDVYNDFYVVTISIPRNDEVFFFVEYLRTRLGYIFPFSKSIYHDENVILINYKDQDRQEVTKKLDRILLENNLTAGISLKFSSIIDLKRHYEQAKFAASIGKLLKTDERVFLYHDLYLYDLLAIVNRHASLKEFCHPGINAILKYDQMNGTDYYHTLYEYLSNGGNMAQVAEKLYIHRNTIYHRLKKICEITNINLDNGDDYLKLLLSFKIVELHQMSSGSSDLAI